MANPERRTGGGIMARWYSDDTQIRWACLQLIKGREISHACEIAEANGWRLSAIVHKLRHQFKWPIVTRYDENRHAHYRLANGTNGEELEKPQSFYKNEKGVAAPPSQET